MKISVKTVKKPTLLPHPRPFQRYSIAPKARQMSLKCERSMIINKNLSRAAGRVQQQMHWVITELGHALSAPVFYNPLILNVRDFFVFACHLMW